MEEMKKIKPKYDYSLLKEDYPDSIPKVKDYIRVICSIHGEFKISYYYHKNGRGCKYCKFNYWTLETCKQEAKKYKTRNEWRKKSIGSYQSAHKNEWVDECAKHMEDSKTGKKWTLDTCKQDARKYKTKNEWKKSSSSYQAALKNGWVDECSKHMKSGYKLRYQK